MEDIALATVSSAHRILGMPLTGYAREQEKHSAIGIRIGGGENRRT